MEKSVRELEADVEAARAKLALNMAVVKSPQARSQFFSQAQQDLKDTVIGGATHSARTGSGSFVDTLKAKATQNPAAVMAIAAGVGWQLYKHPPIASALVGLGLYSLLKSEAVPTDDPLETARRRAKEQVASAAEAAKSGAASLTHNIAEKVGEMTEPAREAGGEFVTEARRRLHDAQDVIAERAERTRENISSFFDQRSGGASSLSRTDGTQLQDTALLAFAALAVTASLGLAWQKRSELPD